MPRAGTRPGSHLHPGLSDPEELGTSFGAECVTQNRAIRAVAAVERSMLPRRSRMTQRMDYNAATPAGVKALGGVYGHIRQSGLPKTLVDLIYLRVSQINGCAYCIDMHSRDLLQESVT